MPVQAPQTIQCPRCNNQLPGWATQCQFCGTPLGNNIPRPAAAVQYRKEMGKSWQEIVYIILAVLWIAQGGYKGAQGMGWVPNAFFDFGMGHYIGIIGMVEVALGIGLLLEQIWAQFLVKILCILQILGYIFGFLLIMMIKDPGDMALAVIMNVIGIGIAGMQLYVISVVGDV